jgi:NADP-dependent 3-hydroxy acid dehydrogenase YdfG
MYFANLRTMFRTCRAVLEQVERVTGRIINVGSRSAMVGVAYETSYCAIKYAVRDSRTLLGKS